MAFQALWELHSFFLDPFVFQFIVLPPLVRVQIRVLFPCWFSFFPIPFHHRFSFLAPFVFGHSLTSSLLPVIRQWSFIPVPMLWCVSHSGQDLHFSYVISNSVIFLTPEKYGTKWGQTRVAPCPLCQAHGLTGMAEPAPLSSAQVSFSFAFCYCLSRKMESVKASGSLARLPGGETKVLGKEEVMSFLQN